MQKWAGNRAGKNGAGYSTILKIKFVTNIFFISRMALPPAGRTIHFFSTLSQQLIFFSFFAKSPTINPTKKTTIF